MALSTTPRRVNHLAPKEFKIVSMRELAADGPFVCDNPDLAADYWRQHIATHPFFNPDVECLAVLLLNARRRVTGHHFVSVGLLDSTQSHPREVFRAAIIGAAAAIILMHNHPSGDPTPSDEDCTITRQLIKVGNIVKIELLDHVIVGDDKHCSLKALGYFYK